MTNINWIAEISNILIPFIVSAKKKVRGRRNAIKINNTNEFKYWDIGILNQISETIIKKYVANFEAKSILCWKIFL